MARFKFRRRGRRNMMRRARRIVKAVSGITLAKRIVTPVGGLTIADISAADFDNPLTFDLIECTEAQDEEAISDGTVVADAPIYSRLKSMKLDLHVSGVSAQTEFRWILYKKPDGEALITDLGTPWHSSSDSPTQRELRKFTLAKGMFVVNTSDLARRLPIFVRRSAFRRMSSLRENDKISLLIAKNAAGTTATLHGFGTIYIQANA